FRFELSGPLTAEGARSLAQDWRTASSVIEDRALVVDLSFVTEIDEAGQRLMLEWRRQGAEFVAKSADARALVEAIVGTPGSAPGEPGRGAYRPWISANRAAAALVGLMVLLMPPQVNAATSVTSPQSLAFGRYVASVENSAPFSESGNIAVDIEASLPGMDKHGHLVAIR